MIALSGCAQHIAHQQEQATHLPETQKISQSKSQSKVLWKNFIGHENGRYYSTLSPVVTNNAVVAATRSGSVIAYDKQSGTVLWKTNLKQNPAFTKKRSARINGGLTFAYQHIFVGSENGVLFALDEKTGAINWQKQLTGELIASPAASDGRVVVYTAAGHLQAFDVFTGQALWSVSDDLPLLTLRGGSEPIIKEGAVIYGKANGKIGFVLLKNGQKIRESIVQIPRGLTDLQRISDVDATPVVHGNLFFGLSYNNILIARDLLSGDEVWRHNYAGYKNMALSGLDLVIIDKHNQIIVVNYSDGHEKWINKQLTHHQITPPTIFGKYIIVGDDTGHLFWIDRNNGEILVKERLSRKGITHAPVIEQNKLFVQTRKGMLYALENPL